MNKQTISLSKYTAAYTVIGEGTPVIFLHGFFGNGLTLEPIMQELKNDYCCIGLDLLGFGDSSKPKMKYFIHHQVELLQEFIATKQIKKFHLIGYSYGGWASAAYAISQARGEDLSGLQDMVLIAPAGIRDDSFVGRYDHMRPLLWDTKLVDVALGVISTFATIFGKSKEFQKIVQARHALVTQPVAKSLLCDRLRPEDAVDTVEKDIHEITIPTLVIAAEADKTIPLWHCQTYAEKIPQAKIEIIPDADHDFFLTHKEKIASMIRTFCS